MNRCKCFPSSVNLYIAGFDKGRVKINRERRDTDRYFPLFNLKKKIPTRSIANGAFLLTENRTDISPPPFLPEDSTFQSRWQVVDGWKGRKFTPWRRLLF